MTLHYLKFWKDMMGCAFCKGGRLYYAWLAILFGFGAMYFADFIFSYTTTLGTFHNGNFGDLVFTIALSLISFGVVGFIYPKVKK